MIYFITAREVNRVKIGYSNDPDRRLELLQTGSPLRLIIERTCDGEICDERALHAMFQPWRRVGEWFELCPEVEAHMQGLDPYVKKLRAFGPKEMAQKTGWSQGYCSMLLTGVRPITLEKSAHIYLTCAQKLGPLAGASDDDCAALLRIVGSIPDAVSA